VSSFLTLVSRPDHQAERTLLFRSGLETFRQAKSRAPSATLETAWVSAAAFPRMNGSGTPIVKDAASGSWLIAAGTWFHRNGLRSGNEAALLERYLEIGSEALAQELEGFFALVIGDGRSREVQVLTDLVGSCHCFARSWEHGTALSTSSFVLAALAPAGLDPVGCQEFLRTGIVYEDRTLFRGVRKLGPATIHRFSASNAPRETRYWSTARLEPDRFKGADAVARVREALVHSAQRVASAFPKPVCDLTGGYDSRGVVSAFLRAGASFETVVSGAADSPDVVVSENLAQLAGIRHTRSSGTEPVAWEQVKRAFTVTDGEYDLVEYGRILRNHEKLLERFDISINGSFGELARGYWWELLLPRVGARRRLDAPRVAARRFAAGASDLLPFPSEWALDLVSHFTGIIERANSGLEGFPNTSQMDNTYLTLRMQRWQGRIASSTDQLWPCLSLFLLRPVLETILQVPARQRRGSAFARRLLLDLNPTLANAPLEHGYPPLPVTWKTLHRFWPVPIHYGKRVRDKILPRRRPAAVGSADPGPPSVRFGSVEEVRDLMQPDGMRLGALVGGETLTRFLRSPLWGSAYEQMWARVLTLEYTLRALERSGAVAATLGGSASDPIS